MAQLCLGCMRTKQQSPVCEHCGYDENKQNAPHQLPVGTLLNGHYLIGRVLGQGGFGITYIAWDQHLSVPVAIKEYFPNGVVHRHSQLGSGIQCENGASPQLFEDHKNRFLKEARILAKLSDIPEIVQIRNFFSENDTAYIVMEYVRGITLKEHLKQLGRPMTEKETLDILEPVLRALQKVHDQQLIHRDISPDNIMLPQEGGVKLIDFGTVRYLDPSGKTQATQAILKPGFAPMEQYNAKGHVGTWTDVYAICASSHYLLTGKVPADVHDRMELGENLTELRKNTAISQKLIDTLENGMRLRAAQRIQTIEQLYRELYETEATKTEKTGKPGKKSRKPVLWAAGFAALLAVSAMLLIPKKEAPVQPLPTQSAAVPPQTTLPAPDPMEQSYHSACTLLEAGQYQEAMEIFSGLGSYQDAVLKAEECRLGILYEEAAQLEAEQEYGRAAIAFGKLGTFRDARERSLGLWKLVPGRKTVSVWYGGEGTMIHALREDGTIAVDAQRSGALTPEYLENYHTAGYTDIVSIHGPIGLRYDGTLALPQAGSQYQELADWEDIVALSIRYCNYPGNTYVGLKSDGTVLATGYNGDGQCEVGHWQDIVAIACGQGYVLGLKADGTVITAGHNEYGQCNVEKWTDIVAISATTNAHVSYGLRADGTVVTAGVNQWNDRSQLPHWQDIVSLYENCGIQADGTMFCTAMTKNQMARYSPLGALTYVDQTPVGLRTDGTLIFELSPPDEFTLARTWTDIQVPNSTITE